jgi:hypothetical protein
VLFVDHDQSQIGELNAFPEQCMGPDHDPGLAGGDPRENSPPAGCRCGSGQQDHLRGMLCRRQHAALREVTQHGGDGVQVLRCQDFRGSQ